MNNLFDSTRDGQTGREVFTPLPKPTPAEVRAIYDAYPRHQGVGKALPVISRAIMQIRATGMYADPVAWMLETVKRYAASRVGQDPQFTPMPASWFNAARYLDDQSCWQKAPSSVVAPPVIRDKYDKRGIIAGTGETIPECTARLDRERIARGEKSIYADENGK